MDEAQNRKISGYPSLSDAEISKINYLKEREKDLYKTLDLIAEQAPADDQRVGRWLALARTHIETGLMFAVKSVARPDRK